MSTTYPLISSLFPTLAIFVGWEGFTILVEFYHNWRFDRIVDRYFEECASDAMKRAINYRVATYKKEDS